MSAPQYNNSEITTFITELREGAKTLGMTLKAEAKQAATHLDALSQAKAQIESGSGLGDVIKTLDLASFTRIDFSDKALTTEKLKTAIDFHINDTIDQAKESGFLKAIKQKETAAAAAAAKAAAENESKDSGFLKKLFSEGGGIGNALKTHNEKMASRTESQRMGISIAQVGLGFVGINIGAGMLQQAAQGVKRKKVFTDGTDGNKQLAAITAVPVGGMERTFRATTGAVITAAGIGSLLLGTTNFSKRF